MLPARLHDDEESNQSGKRKNLNWNLLNCSQKFAMFGIVWSGISREGVAPSPTPWCSSYRKGSLRVTLDYGRQLIYIYIYIYIYISQRPKYRIHWNVNGGICQKLPPQSRCDTRSNLNKIKLIWVQFSFSSVSCQTKAKTQLVQLFS